MLGKMGRRMWGESSRTEARRAKGPLDASTRAQAWSLLHPNWLGGLGASLSPFLSQFSYLYNGDVRSVDLNWQRLETFLVVSVGRMILLVSSGIRDADHPTKCRTAPYIKALPCPKGHSVKVEKPCVKLSWPTGNCQTIFQNGYAIFKSPQNTWGFPFLHSLTHTILPA